ncbi:MAG: hypothetical protein ACKOXB_08685 [Flavobacteriales bacterium]
MKNTIFVFLMLLVVSASAQLDTFDFKNEKYLVHPFRVENAEEVKKPKYKRHRIPGFGRHKYSSRKLRKMMSEVENELSYELFNSINSRSTYTYSDYSHFNGEIPPVFDSLPTGKYVLLQDAPNTRKNRWRKRFGKEVLPLVRAEFSVEDGKINGRAILYTESGLMDKKLYYAAGLKDGECQNIFHVNGDSTYANISHYRMGLLDGPYTDYRSHNGKIYVEEEGTYKNGNPYGWHREYFYDEVKDSTYLSVEYFAEESGKFSKHYKEYYYNGKLMLESYADSASGLVNTEPPFSSFIDSLVTEKNKKGEAELRTVYSSFYTDHIPSETPFICYHRNGALMAKYSYDDSGNTIFDTIFTSSGKPVTVRTVLPDTNEHKRYVLTDFDLDGKIEARRFFASDSTGDYGIYQREGINKEGKYMVEFAEYAQLFEPGWKESSTDTLRLISIETHGGNVKYKYESPVLDHQKFIRTEDSERRFALDFKITSYDTASPAYQTILTASKAKLVLYTFKDTSSMADKRISSGKAFKQLMRLRTKGNFMDSLLLFYDGMPYTGRFDLCMHKEDEMVAKKGNKLVLNPFDLKTSMYSYDVAYGEGESEYDDKRLKRRMRREMRKQKLFLGRSHVELQFVNGRLVHGELKFNTPQDKITGYCDFKNSLPHGKLYARNIRKGAFGRMRKDETIETSLYEGFLDGKTEQWSYDKKEKKRYLKEVGYNDKGMPVDSNVRYYSNGKVASCTYYNKEGKLNGASIDYTKEGKIKAYSFYENGKQQGITYRINEIGDTMMIRNYVNDTLEGPAYDASIDYRTYKIKSQCYINYHKGEAVGNFTFMDGFGMKRLVFTIDSSRIDYFQYDYLLPNWESLLAFAGKVKVFHPNGKLYAEGNMQMYPETKEEKYAYNEDYMYEGGFDGDYEYSPVGEDYAAPLKMYKNGVWSYYNSVGRKLAEINYTQDSSYVMGADTSFAMGTYTGYYDNGRLKYKGFLISEEPVENCESDLGEVEFIANYSTYVSASGDTLVKNGTGKLQIFNHDGGLKFEGEVKNFKKQGWWKEYNKEGKLIGAGQYSDDMKNGRWLSGDLTGLNYLDGGCYESEIIKEKVDKANKYKIEIVETIYENDEEKSTQTYTFTRSVE